MKALLDDELMCGTLKPREINMVKAVDRVASTKTEPIMAETLINYYTPRIGSLTTWALDDRHSPIVRSKQFERLIPFIVAPGLFSTALDKEIHPLLSDLPTDLPDVFKGKWSLCTSAYGVMANEELVGESVQRHSVGHWLNDWKLAGWSKAIGRFPPFFFPSDSFGGDIAFLVFREKGQDASGKSDASASVDQADTMLVVIQSKLVNKLGSLSAALRTLDPALSYCQNRGKAKPVVVNRYSEARRLYLDAIRSIPVIRILFAFPTEINLRASQGRNRSATRSTGLGQTVNSSRVPSTYASLITNNIPGETLVATSPESVREARTSTICEDLLLIVDAHNARGVLSEEVCSLIKSVERKHFEQTENE